MIVPTVFSILDERLLIVVSGVITDVDGVVLEAVVAVDESRTFSKIWLIFFMIAPIGGAGTIEEESASIGTT